MVKLQPNEYQSTLLKAKDLEDDIVTATIKAVEMEELPQTGPTRCVMFSEYGKSLPLNKTNTVSLVDLFGDETDNWIDKKVKLVKSEANNPETGKAQQVIRIREATKGKK